MIVMVEGPAAAGKTSFVEAVSRRRPSWHIVPEIMSEATEEPKNLQLFLKNDLLKAAKAKELASTHPDDVILVDRGHASALAFAYAERHQGRADDFARTLRWYKEQRAAGNLVVPDRYVYISATKPLITDRAKAGGWYRDSLIWLKDPDAAMDYYEQFFNELEPQVPVLRYDGSVNSDELAVKFIADMA